MELIFPSDHSSGSLIRLASANCYQMALRIRKYKKPTYTQDYLSTEFDVEDLVTHYESPHIHIRLSRGFDILDELFLEIRITKSHNLNYLHIFQMIQSIKLIFNNTTIDTISGFNLYCILATEHPDILERIKYCSEHCNFIIIPLCILNNQFKINLPLVCMSFYDSFLDIEFRDYREWPTHLKIHNTIEEILPNIFDPYISKMISKYVSNRKKYNKGFVSTKIGGFITNLNTEERRSLSSKIDKGEEITQHYHVGTISDLISEKRFPLTYFPYLCVTKIYIYLESKDLNDPYDFEDVESIEFYFEKNQKIYKTSPSITYQNYIKENIKFNPDQLKQPIYTCYFPDTQNMCINNYEISASIKLRENTRREGKAHFYVNAINYMNYLTGVIMFISN